ncbi:type II secretion system F family protein [Niameybacter sp.]|uniref:type II secretion system F family protein n=1 Tax=Niameybacter sp. TaxID=2033640 RepID=UPI002FCBA21B
MTYKYGAQDQADKRQKGMLEVENQQALFDALRGFGLKCIYLKECIIKKKEKVSKIPLKQLVIICRQLATMLGAGVSIMKCMDILCQQTEEIKLKSVLLTICEDIQRGNALSTSLHAQDKIFPNLMISMVKCGEESGTLDQIFLALTQHYENEVKVQNKVKQAMLYPIILGCISFAVVIFLLRVVVPTFADMFGEYGALPMITQVLLRVSKGLEDYGMLILCSGLLMAVGLYFTVRTVTCKKWIDEWKLTMPIVGKLNKIILSARFAEVTFTLYASGMPMVDVMEITQSVMGNSYIDQRFNSAKEAVNKGVALSEAMKEIGIFPPILSNMILVGEESGQLEDILHKTAVFYQEEADVAIQKLVALLEPMMIIFLGMIVGLIVGAILPPMYEMIGNIQ